MILWFAPSIEFFTEWNPEVDGILSLSERVDNFCVVNRLGGGWYALAMPLLDLWLPVEEGYPTELARPWDPFHFRK